MPICQGKMSFPDVIDLCSDDEVGEANGKVVKQEPGVDTGVKHNENSKHQKIQLERSKTHTLRQEPRENGSSRDQGTSDASRLPPAPIIRQFWKAGEYDQAQAPKVILESGQNRLRVHPKFLHSNATSHKWAFGAIAELLDNAFDEIQKGASFVMVDKVSNSRDGSPALLIQDDGGGMDPESMRRCMSFGFSDKKSKSAIGHYGNGFKTSTMRLGADVIAFSRHVHKRELTQSVGLLSYTFLRQTGHDRIVVPMVDYEFDVSTHKLRPLSSYSTDHFSTSLSMILQWSPFKTEAELLKQFDDIGPHGTKVIIYSLWFNDDGELEFDFESDPEDILIRGAPKIVQTSNQPKMIAQQHVANRFPYSLRVYSSILYLRLPKPFRIILRGRVVEHHNLANDLKFPEFILYKPQLGGNNEAAVVTTIGFLRDAPHVNVHGFSVYHKNRLIMPFWRVVSQTNSRGRGVVGVLEANFIEPTHNKQDFEKTLTFQKLEARLKDMTLEYWDYHCGLIGYNQLKKSSTVSLPRSKPYSGIQPVTMNPGSPVNNSPRVVSAGEGFQDSVSPRFSGGRSGETGSQPGLPMKRKAKDSAAETGRSKRRAGAGANAAGENRHDLESQPANGTKSHLQDQEIANLMKENKKLHAQCLEYEKAEKELNEKMQQLEVELIEVQQEYERLVAESKLLLDAVKVEKV